MIIVNGSIFREDGTFRIGDIHVENGKITAIRDVGVQDDWAIENAEEVIEAQGLYVIPGLVDIHLHGCVGYDFSDGTKEAFMAIAEFEASQGVTSIVPATMTLPREELLHIMTEAGKYILEDDSVIKGITMEGPFISREKKGAQNEAYIQKANKVFWEELQEASCRRIRQVTIAPEIEGTPDFVRSAKEETVVSVAHTTAEYDRTMTAFEAGANHVTHLYNAMPALGHREPGVIGAAFDKKDVFVELICDGEHVHPSVVRATFQMFGADRICMISDSMRATGMPDGEYSLGGQQVWVSGDRAVLEDGHLAASVTTLYGCLRKAVLEMHIPLEDAVLACTKTPARSLKLDEECGVLAVGRSADMLLLDKNLERKYVIKDGLLL